MEGGGCSQGVPALGGLVLGGCLLSGGGCLVLGGVCLVQEGSGPGGACSGGMSGGDPPGRLLLRAVRILLECILVLMY